ncbi:MAG: phenylalanine--tRNA ligase subunit beta [Dehalococcoidia bacterium]|nr:phenylalanine--tRNA ligase subunit beta [Dehalococcoidia bacterium]
MRVSLKWLKDYVTVTIPPADVAERLTMAGCEVKGLETIGGEWENILVGQITAVNPHPNADRLRRTTVNLGKEQQTVVCGAPNVRVGDKIVFARTGAKLMDGHTGQVFRLKAAKIRGVESAGMVCSEKELGLSENHAGIMVLPPDVPVGMPLTDLIGDTIFDLEITPNRPDCLSVIGIAREVAVLIGKAVCLPEVKYEESEPPVSEQMSIEIVAPDLCPRYCASLITGVQVKPSPNWMQERLLACGMRPINNVVDVTNYVMLEYGQPLHSFDYHTIGGRKIIVRRAYEGESIISLDGVERALTPDMLVIADEKRAVAIAGVMGGANTEVSDQTTAILLEAANFNPPSIHSTGDVLRLPSEARYRFERGISPELAMYALRRATQLIVELTGGKAAKGLVDVYPGKKAKEPVTLSVDKARRLLGIDFGAERMVRTLKSLGFECEITDSQIKATPPYWRSDIRLEVDVIEEIARIIGYDKIPATLLGEPLPKQTPDPMPGLKREVRSALVAYGFTDVLNFSLTGMDMMNRLMPEPHAIEPAPIRVANPMTAEMEYLRLNLRAGLLAAFAANRKHEDGSIRLFEMGKVYIPRGKGLPDERENVCGVMGGFRLEKSWQESEPLDFFDAKGVAETLFQRLGLEAAFETSSDDSLHANKQAAIIVACEKVGVVGEVHPRVLAAFEINEPVYLLEIDLRTLLPLSMAQREYHPVPRFPAIVRDMALVVDSGVTHARVQSIIKSFPLVEKAEIFDVYAGEQVSVGKKSMAYRLTFRSADQTLTDDDASRVQEQILSKLIAEVGAVLRG